MAKSSGVLGEGSIGRYYNNNRCSPDFERFVKKVSQQHSGIVHQEVLYNPS